MLRILAIVASLLLAGCGLPGNVVVLMPDDDGTVGKAEITNAGATVTLDHGLAAVGTKPGGAPGEVFAAKAGDVDQAFAGAVAATPRKPVSYIIYFLNRQAVPEPSSRAVLEAAIASAKRTPNVDISVTGHADATGAEAENLELSLRRAETVRNELIRAGIATNVIDLAYHGANNPLVPTPAGVPEPRNRRVEITIR
jgi:outer membrane protein OmpA-like peptidoglycan-associated protein